MIKKILLSAILVVSAVQFSMGQGENDLTKSQQVTINIQGLWNLEFTGQENEIFDFTDATHFENGIPRQVGSLNIASNRLWKVMARVDLSEITLDETASLHDDFFQISAVASGSSVDYINLVSQTPTELFRGNRGGSHSYLVNYKIKPGYIVVPGDYKVNVQYTLTDQ